jgi:hypothetical protein
MNSSNIKAREKLSFTYKDFKGVDFTNSSLKANIKRGILSKNIVKENGIHQKRKGWKELIHFHRVSEIDNTTIIEENINGIYQLGSKTVVQVGKKFYYTTQGLAENAVFTEIDTSTISTNIIDDKSYGIVSKGSLYILCGDYLVYNGTSMTKVIGYIPTTTISIDPLNAPIQNQASYEEVNLLSQWRKNKLNSVSTEVFTANSMQNLSYILDTSIVGSATDKVKIEITYYDLQEVIAGNETTNPIYKNVYKTIVLENEIGEVASNEIVIDTGDLEWAVKTTVVILKDINGNANVTLKTNKTPNATTGFIQLTYYEDGVSVAIPLDHITNIEVTYPHYVANSEEKITKCKFGTMFGYKRSDRLFVSGNSEYANMDWYSSEEDLTYFPDLNYTPFGTTNNSIVGYSLISDSVMAVLKSYSNQEPTIYYRTVDLANVTDDTGDYVYRQDGGTYTSEVFPVRVGNIGESLVNRHTLAYLNGDNLMLSRNGVFGIVVNANLSNEQRYARPRSRLVENEITSEEIDFSNVVSTVYKGKYYLALNNANKDCYVADSKDIYQLEDDLNDTFQYEWYRLENIPARLFYQNGIDNKLYFATSKGQICVFTDKDYVDSQTVYINGGGIGVNMEDNSLVFNSAYTQYLEQLGDNDYVDIEAVDNANSIVVESLAKGLDIEEVLEDTITLKITANQMINKVRYCNGLDVYVKEDVDIQAYKLVVDEFNFTIKLQSKFNELAYREFESIPTELLIPLQRSKIVNVDTVNYTFKLLDYEYKQLGEDLETVEVVTNVIKDISVLGTETNNLKGILHLYDNVKAYWETPPTNLGNTFYTKSLNSIVTTYETVQGGQVEVGVITREITKDYEVEGTNILDFSNLDFNNFTFETSAYAKSYNKLMKLKNFNFISVYYKSENDKNVAINEITLVYSLGKKIKGVK